LCDSKGIGCASKIDEGVKVEGGACRPLQLLDGGVRQLEDGACIYESQISNLSEEEQEEPSQTMGDV
jgi:hypothetical protein